MVIWLIGISGAGKTTLGNMLQEYLKERNKKSFVIDGNIVRDFFENDLGYSREDRMANLCPQFDLENDLAYNVTQNVPQLSQRTPGNDAG